MQVDEIATSHHPRKGAPRIDDMGEILAHFTAQLASGRSITAIAKAGLKFLGYVRQRDGSHVGPVILRELQGATLERRYRKARAFVDQSVASAASLLIDISHVSAAKTPLSFPIPRAVTRGRPKKTCLPKNCF